MEGVIYKQIIRNRKMKHMKVEYCGICDKGKCRSVNQDTLLMKARGNRALFIVADGIGGHQHGETASSMIAAETKAWWERHIMDDSNDDFEQKVLLLYQCIEYVNRKIYEQYNRNGICGSTIVALFAMGKKYCVISVGDSRIYYQSKWCFKQLTVDDVWENQKDVRVMYRFSQLKKHGNYGKLIRAVGIEKDLVVVGSTDILKAGDTFLLCSDGLYKSCAVDDIKRVLRKYRKRGDGENMLKGLLNIVYENGAKDNISIILARWTG